MKRTPRKGLTDDTVALVSDEDLDHIIPSSDDLSDLPPEWYVCAFDIYRVFLMSSAL